VVGDAGGHDTTADEYYVRSLHSESKETKGNGLAFPASKHFSARLSARPQCVPAMLLKSSAKAGIPASGGHAFQSKAIGDFRPR
jgi:hypothetical protein